MLFRIQRYNPDADARPYMQDYDIEIGPSDRMLLDALVRIKTLDDTLSLRRSCREGVCGSDAMNINGRNGLACVTKLVELKEPVVIKPLPGLPIIRDLIVDMTHFFAQYHSALYVPPHFARYCGRRRSATSVMVRASACAV